MTHSISIEEKFGKWKSIITSKTIAEKTIGFSDIQVDNGIVYWVESRPFSQGRSFIVSYDLNNFVRDETQNTMSIGSNVHGYGGGSFLAKDNILYFVDSITKQIYKKDIIKNTIVPITSDSGYDYADFSVDQNHNYLYCVRLNENSSKQFPPTEIIRIHLHYLKTELLFSGADFYSNVRVNEDGTKILFLQWNYPNMPWDENELWVANVNPDSQIGEAKKLFHKSRVSLYQPEWKNGAIYCAIDSCNYWNLYRITDNDITCLMEYPGDFARPLWVAGTKSFSFISDHEILANCCEKGIWKTFIINVEKKTHIQVHNKLTFFSNMNSDYKNAAFIAGHETLGLCIWTTSVVNLNCEPKIIASQSSKTDLSNGISTPQQIEFISNGKIVYAFYYPPKNTNFHGPRGEKPPCLIKIHGGPTANADSILNQKIQFYTSRGYAYVDINYSGSSGYGREYRERLNKNWGFIDVQDCIACANYLVKNNLAHKDKLILSGSSAGGFTLLHVLAQCTLFKCACCHYGVSDLIEMAKHIHKFEACYDQNLIGDNIHNNPNLFLKRSPIYHADKIKTRILFFHGDKDPVVHMNQTIKIAEKLKENHIPCEVVILEGEGHGFKKEQSIVTVLEKELSFFESEIIE